MMHWSSQSCAGGRGVGEKLGADCSRDESGDTTARILLRLGPCGVIYPDAVLCM